MAQQNDVFGFEEKTPFLDFALSVTRENCVKFRTCGVICMARSQSIHICMRAVYADTLVL
jgi:hypothetical protein